MGLGELFVVNFFGHLPLHFSFHHGSLTNALVQTDVCIQIRALQTSDIPKKALQLVRNFVVP